MVGIVFKLMESSEYWKMLAFIANRLSMQPASVLRHLIMAEYVKLKRGSDAQN